MASPNLWNYNATLPGVECLGPNRIDSELRLFTMVPDIHYAVIPGVNMSAPWMETCCEPNPIHWVNECYVWCEMPERYIERDPETRDIRRNNFEGCLNAEDRPFNESRAFGYGYDYGDYDGVTEVEGGSGAAAVAGRGALGVMGWGVVGLALLGVLGF